MMNCHHHLLCVVGLLVTQLLVSGHAISIPSMHLFFILTYSVLDNALSLH